MQTLSIPEKQALIIKHQTEITDLRASIKHDIDTANGPYKTQFNLCMDRIKSLDYERHYYRFSTTTFFTINCKKARKFRDLYPQKISRKGQRFSAGCNIFDGIEESEWKKVAVTI